MNVAVEHGHRTEAREKRERLRAVLRSPAPFGINDPEGNMREDDDRLRCRPAFQIVRQPGELFGAEIAETTGLQIDDVDEADEMHACLIEGIPAGAARLLAEA